MSMHVHIYVGPYLEVTDLEDEVIWDLEDVLTNARGEAGVDETTRYLVPNRKVPGIERELEFSEQDCPSPVNSVNQIMENRHFMNYSQSAVETLKSAGAEVVHCW